MKLLLFDVDGTLCNSGKKISEATIQALKLLNQKDDLELMIVGGGTYNKIKDQIEPVCSLFSYLMTENGIMSYNQKGDLIYQNSLRNQWNDYQVSAIVEALMDYNSKVQGLPVKTGKFIDLRRGLIYFCPIGQNCTEQDRKDFVVYDKKHSFRIKMIEQLKNKYSALKDLEMSLGGQLGISISPMGWDKSFIENIVDFDCYDKIHFFGDKLDEYGSDAPVKKIKQIKCHQVDNPTHTIDLLEKLF